MANIYDMSDTWNAGATTFTAIKMDVTDSASASDSLLMDLQVGGSSTFRIRKDGSAAFSVAGGDTTEHIISTNNGGYFTFARGGAVGFALYESGGFVHTRSDGYFGFTPTTTAAATTDLRLYRDAANTLAQRNSTNAQTFNLYNTYTDASNYERGFMKWNTNVLEIGTQAAGTGTVRSLVLQRVSQIRASADADQYINMAGAGYFSFIDNAGLEVVRYGGTLQVRAAWSVDWSSTTAPGGTKDAGIKRAAAGQLQITDGSTGTGELIFIVPTSDPGITGALWNNAGTLSISA